MSNKPKSVVLIGAGNVATSLAEALKDKREIIQVYSKTRAHAKALGQKLKCSFTDDLKEISPDADLYIIAVKDDSIAEVCKGLKLTGKLVIHTSGSTALSVLKRVSDKNGVLWPMYSFAGKASLVSGIPFFMEASDARSKKELTTLVKEFEGKPYYMNTEKRVMLHIAAVFINNFPNHLFAIAENLCKEAKVPFNIFLPLVQETMHNIEKKSPALTQTGPANRKDKLIINRHLALLSKDKKLKKYKEVYKVLTESIIATSRGGRKKR